MASAEPLKGSVIEFACLAPYRAGGLHHSNGF
jgi:hypothetical protein